MVEGVFLSILRAFVEIGGPPYLIAALFAIVIVLQHREMKATERSRFKEAEECNKIRAELYEKRISEGQATLTALQASTTSLAAMAVSVDARSLALQKMTEAVLAMSANMESNRQYFSAAAERMERRLESIERMKMQERGGRQ